MDDFVRRQYFDAAKKATTRETVNAAATVNCCGEGDAVKVHIEGQMPNGVIVARIIDKMKSVNGKVGDMLSIPQGKITIRLYSPFVEPIVFINGLNQPYCISFPSGG